MGIRLSVTVQDLEGNLVRTFETEVDGDPNKQKDRDKAIENLVKLGAPELIDIEVEVVVEQQEIWWAPSAIVHAHIIDP